MELSMSEIIGKLSAKQKLIAIELSSLCKVYGDNVPVGELVEMLKRLEADIIEAEKDWENRK